ncbi:MAG: DUF6173 family protein [Neomegalonema sp.]|nr:DUF6173 family protein [Neomegalonema sp.]
MFKLPMLRASKVTTSLTPAKPDCKAVGCQEDNTLPVEREPLPEPLKEADVSQKSEAQWAYERLILYIQNFEKHLDDDHEVGLGFVSGGVGAMRISGMGYFAPDLVTFYGVDDHGAKTQLVQHVSQLNVTLKAAPKLTEKPRRIGFELRRSLENAQQEGEPES